MYVDKKNCESFGMTVNTKDIWQTWKWRVNTKTWHLYIVYSDIYKYIYFNWLLSQKYLHPRMHLCFSSGYACINLSGIKPVYSLLTTLVSKFIPDLPDTATWNY